MKREELEVGQWYKALSYSDQYYQFLSVVGDVIRANYINGGSEYFADFVIGNTDFWANCREAEYSEYEQWLPKEYKIQAYELY